MGLFELMKRHDPIEPGKPAAPLSAAVLVSRKKRKAILAERRLDILKQLRNGK